MQPPNVARIVVKVDVRRKEPLLAVLFAQEPVRRTLGEISFSLAVNDSARHVGYITLEWSSFASARSFFDSEKSQSLIAEWPVVELLEVVLLKDITADYVAYRASDRPPKEVE